jgi:hypothetical protein
MIVGDLEELVRALFLGGKPAEGAGLRDDDGTLYLGLRIRGRLVHEEWTQSENQDDALRVAIEQARSAVKPREWRRIDVVELCVCGTFRDIDLTADEQRSRFFANVHRGIHGLAFQTRRDPTTLQLISPTTAIATNRKPERALARFCDEHGLSQNDVAKGAVLAWTFDATQVLIPLGESADAAPARPLLRGSRCVKLDEITPSAVQQLEQLLGDYLVNSIEPNGRMRYIYYPSRGEEDTSRNNQIRQWMATWATCRLAERRESRRIHKQAERNLRYNLAQFYSTRDDLGLIDENGKVKLGAVALAVMTIRAHPNRDEYREAEQHLWATIDRLWRESGEFRTFLVPADRNDVQNFYPGEALLAWSLRYVETRDDELLDRFMKSFLYYREWHREQPNPAFIPWHTQAYYTIWRENRDPELQAFVFEMNDWLLDVQQWDEVEYDDCRGRFHDPQRPFGPPHASATGVYLEGLADAFVMAREVNDLGRADAYRTAILRGLRSVCQLTFKDDTDMFYVAKRDLLRGGVRTTVYDNVVRVDNVQHNLLAILKVLSAFSEDDYQLAASESDQEPDACPITLSP